MDRYRNGGVMIGKLCWDFCLNQNLYQFRLHRNDGEWEVEECGIIDLDFIIPMQPETILLTTNRTYIKSG